METAGGKPRHPGQAPTKFNSPAPTPPSHGAGQKGAKMRVYSSMPTAEFVYQLRTIAINAKAHPLVLDQIDAIVDGPTGAVTLDQISAKARQWAEHYPQSSDGRNTFILFAEWVETLAPADSHAELVKALEFYADRGRYDGPNQRLIGNDPHTPKDQGYLQDVTRDCGDIARAALATLTAREVR